MPRKSTSAPAQTAASRVQRAAAKSTGTKVSAKPAARPAVKPALKPSAKPAVKPTSKPAAKPAAKAAPAKAGLKAGLKAAVKTAARALAQPPARKSAVKPAARAKGVAPTPALERAPVQDARPVLVRDSFTMPEPEYAVLLEVKQACLRAGIDVKKSELLRIGVALLGQLDVATLQGVLAALPQLKTGRPPAQG